jgi:hypothetical protein
VSWVELYRILSLLLPNSNHLEMMELNASILGKVLSFSNEK